MSTHPSRQTFSVVPERHKGVKGSFRDLTALESEDDEVAYKMPEALAEVSLCLEERVICIYREDVAL
jgi:hypothetical protein